MDTDSYYIAFSREDWESLVKIQPDQYAELRRDWLPRTC